MRAGKLCHKLSEFYMFKIAAASDQLLPPVVTYNKTGESKQFTYVKSTNKFIRIHYCYLANIIKTHRKSIYYNENIT